MIQRGDKLLWLQYDMPGQVVDLQHGDVQAEWEEGYASPFSGRAWWGAMELIEAGLIMVIGENEEETRVPENLLDLTGRDMFKEAFELVFEL